MLCSVWMFDATQLIIRAISVLEGIALVGNPEFAIVDEAYPFISKRLMTDESPRLRAAFRYMVWNTQVYIHTYTYTDNSYVSTSQLSILRLVIVLYNPSLT